MAGLRAKVIKDSFQSLLRVDSDSGLTGSTLLQVEDGDGVDTGLSIASDKIGANVIEEKTAASGVTIDSSSGSATLIKDGTVTSSAFVGNLTGNVTGTASSATSAIQAGVATALQTARTIGGVSFNGVSSIVPTTIVVADTTDTSCNVALFESATGDLLPKTDGELTYNASTNTLASPLITATTVTATNFAGTLTTAAQANVTSLGTLTSLQVDGVNVNASTINMAPVGITDGSKYTITTAANGVTSMTTVDGVGAAGHLSIIADGDIYLKPTPGGGIHLQDSDASAYVPSHDRHAINKAYADVNYNVFYQSLSMYNRQNGGDYWFFSGHGDMSQADNMSTTDPDTGGVVGETLIRASVFHSVEDVKVIGIKGFIGTTSASVTDIKVQFWLTDAVQNADVAAASTVAVSDTGFAVLEETGSLTQNNAYAVMSVPDVTIAAGKVLLVSVFLTTATNGYVSCNLTVKYQRVAS